jgi:toxin CcdB
LPRQFDIVESLNPARSGRYPLLIILQHDRVIALRSVVAAPLVEATADLMASRLHPSVTIAGRRYVVLTEQLAAIAANTLGRTVASAESVRYEIVAAVDLLFTGI